MPQKSSDKNPWTLLALFVTLASVFPAQPSSAYSDKYLFGGSTSVSYAELTSIGREGVRIKALNSCKNAGGNVIRDVQWSFTSRVVYSYQCFKRT